MANQRSPDQKFIGFWANKSFASKINEDRGLVPISAWLRNTVADYLESRGYKISSDEKTAPDRAGKGGPKSSNMKNRQGGFRSVNSKPISRAAVLLDTASSVAVSHQAPKSQRKP